jgi:hypothetical protein
MEPRNSSDWESDVLRALLYVHFSGYFDVKLIRLVQPPLMVCDWSLLDVPKGCG